MRIAEFISPELCWVETGGASRDEILRQIARRVADASPEVAFEPLYAALLAREQKGSTATPEGVAFPHAMLPGVGRNFVAVALVRGGVDFQRKGSPRADLVIALVGPQDRAWEHLRLLARVARVCHADGLARLRTVRDAEQLYAMVVKEDESHG
jgi:mannitol/fructose-specific phosphotransferase system IIA component (Ntr-type)